MHRRRSKSLACLAIASATIATAQTLQPGDYEITFELQLPGTTEPTLATATQCLAPEDARDLRAILTEAMGSHEDCTYSNLTTEGNKTSWDAVCDDTSSHTELTHNGDAFTAVVTTKIDGETFVANMRARRVSATCAPDDDDE